MLIEVIQRKMDNPKILDVIKANPELPYGEVRRQAMESGLSRVDFDMAWAEAYPEEKGLTEHDRKVREISDEVAHLGVDTKTHEAWKSYFKAKGCGDDECDLGLVLSGAKINYGPLKVKWMLFWSIGASILLFFGFQWLMGSNQSNPPSGMANLVVLIFSSLPLLIYLGFLSKQFQKFCWKVIERDFGAKVEPDPGAWMSKWKASGAVFLGVPNATLENIYQLKYDSRETYFGTYSFWVRTGKSRTKVEKFVVVQRTRQVYPCANCVRPLQEGTHSRKKVQLEGVDFGAKFKVYSEKPVDAFYVFNPRVMSALLEPEILKTLNSFETAGDWVILIFNGVFIGTGIHLGGPVIRYEEYQKAKRILLQHLDLATDINDVLSRQIVDDGTKRSDAKIR
jgi:hypothetical protein